MVSTQSRILLTTGLLVQALALLSGCATSHTQSPLFLPGAGVEAGGESVSSGAAVGANQYVLQPTDEIELQVFREPDFSGTFVLSPAGEIKHPVAGVIKLGGLNIAGAEAHIAEVLGENYIVSPKVIVKLTRTESSQIVIFGEVRKPGIIPVPVGEPVTLLKAIALAGGFTELASPDRVRIVRKDPEGGTTSIRARVADMLGGSSLEQDIKLEPGDVIVVPEIVF